MDENHKDGEDHTTLNNHDDGNKCKKCIFRVPNVLRRQNPEAYTPDVVSIGPFHHCPKTEEAKEDNKEGTREKDFELVEGVKQLYFSEILAGMKKIEEAKEDNKEATRKKDFQLVEGVKQLYLSEILADMKKTKQELTLQVMKLSSHYNGEGEFENQARGFYAEPLDDHIKSEDFIEMMIVDGCFLVQLFRKYSYPKLRVFDDQVFNMSCMLHFLCHDILLLENQLPWFVIQSFYDHTHHLYPSEASLSTLILDAFSTLPSLKQSCASYKKHLLNKHKKVDPDILHILDLLRHSLVFPLRTIEQRGSSHSRDVHDAIFDPDQHQIRTATDLAKADIKFKMVQRESIMDIGFEKGRYFTNGILMIPQLNIGMSSETLFRNFIAIEQCYHDYLNEITSYAILMDNLISSKEDMDLLCKKKVIGNWMSDEDGCKFFSNLYKDIPHNKFYYVKVCKQVNDCYKSRWYEWLAILKSEKFSDPWRIAAFGIGIILLILTAWSQTNNIRVNMHRKLL